MKKLLVLTALILFAGIVFSQTKKIKALQKIDSEIWSTGNVSLYDEILSPEFVAHNVDIGEDIIGIEAQKEAITSLLTAFPDIKPTIDETIIKGDKYVEKWTVTGTHTGPLTELPPTGKKVKFSGVTIRHVVDGKISEEWVFYNQAALMTQLGFTITPPEE